MSRIACLGWGSLIWDPRELPIQTEWYSDGPFVNVEFVRMSSDKRITLVLCDQARPIPSLWSIMTTSDLDTAKAALRKRENISEKNNSSIGSWRLGEQRIKNINLIDEWAEAHEIDAVIWTALPPKFNNKIGVIPSWQQVVAHLSSLTGETRIKAEEYVRKAPRQITTEYRGYIESQLDWTVIEP